MSNGEGPLVGAKWGDWVKMGKITARDSLLNTSREWTAELGTFSWIRRQPDLRPANAGRFPVYDTKDYSGDLHAQSA